MCIYVSAQSLILIPEQQILHFVKMKVNLVFSSTLVTLHTEQC